MIGRTDELIGARSGLHRLVVGYAVAGIAQGLVFGALVPILRSLFVGEIPVGWIAAAAAGAVLSSAALMTTSNIGYYVGIDAMTDTLMRRVFRHVGRLPLGWFTSGRTGQVSAVMSTSLQHLMSVPSVFLQQLTIAVTTPATVVVVTVFVDWRIALAMVVPIPLLYWLFRSIKAVTGPDHRREEKSTAAVAERVLEFASVQPVLRATGQLAHGWSRLDDALDDSRASTVRSLDRQNAPLARFAAAVAATLVLVLVVATGLTQDGTVPIADAAAIMLLATRFVEPLALVGAYASGLQMADAAIDSVAQILDEPPLSEPVTPQQPRDTSIEFDGVTFGYGPDYPVLDGVSLRCEPNSMTALVGPSGSGKTTVIRLAARFWDTTSGTVRLGGVDVRELGTTAVMNMIAMVSQDVYLFDATIEDNVRLARPEANTADVHAAARAARLDLVVDDLPSGWATRVGEGGSLLSGGQRQRVAIARAILKDAPIVLLDEATAALDGENEAAVVDALVELAVGRTVVVIAHRLSTIRHADRIVVLDRGTVRAEGTHNELVDTDEVYREFFDDRRAAAGWTLRRKSSIS